MKLTHWPGDPLIGARDPAGATLGAALGVRLGDMLGLKLGARLGDRLGDELGGRDGGRVGTTVGMRDGVDDGAAEALELGDDVRSDDGVTDDSELGDGVEGILGNGVDVGPSTDGNVLDNAIGSALGEAVGIREGSAEGGVVGVNDSCRLGADDGEVDIVQVPHVDVPLVTRVPVVLLYDPVRPDIVTKLPVTTPEELAQPPPDVVARPNQLPDAPLAELSYDNVAGGLPDPVQPDDEQNKQPAVHIVHTVGQSADDA